MGIPNAQYPALEMHIAGRWCQGSEGAGEEVVDTSTEASLGRVPHVAPSDLEAALATAKEGFSLWRTVVPLDQAKILCQAASGEHGDGAISDGVGNDDGCNQAAPRSTTPKVKRYPARMFRRSAEHALNPSTETLQLEIQGHRVNEVRKSPARPLAPASTKP